MDKPVRTDSRLARRNREERPVHPSTRDLVFSLATCGSLFVLGSWSLTAVGCASGSKTNEQRMAQRRNVNPSTGTYATPNTVQVNNKKGKVAPGVMTLSAEGSFDTVSGYASNANQGGTQYASATPNANSNRMTSTSAPRTGKKPVFNMVELATADSVEGTTPGQPMLTAAYAPNEKAYLPNGTPTMMANLVNPTVMQPGNLPSTTTVTHGKPAPNYANSGTQYARNTNGFSRAVNTGWNGNGSMPTSNYASNGGSNGNGGAFANSAVAVNRNGNRNGTTESTTVDTMELSRQLANAFAQAGSGSMDPVRVWFVYSSLAVSNPEIKLPQGWDNDLIPVERERVMAAYSGFTALGRAFRDGDAQVDGSIRQALIAAITGEPALTIPKVDLCTKVTGFGDYAPVSRRSFLAGAPNRVIVYSELDGFKSQLENGKWTTRLATRVSIVPANGGNTSNFVAWSRTPEWTEVIDTSDSPRSDFFLGEIIPIASNLKVGNYNLRVEVKDLATGAVTSQVLPIEVLDERTFAAMDTDKD